ncbi:MAG: tetratricopeptide repeat protein [Saprospiraceae bacterium]|nr:tetratricopeptide repeat protein [Saprospiraceae bacterium]
MHRLYFYVLAIFLISSTISFTQSKKINFDRLFNLLPLDYISTIFKYGIQRFILISVILLLGSFSMLGQSKIQVKIDSLKTLAEKAKDPRFKTDQYLNIAEQYFNIDLVRAKEYAEMAEQLAYKNQLKDRYSELHLIHGFALGYLGDFKKAIHHLNLSIKHAGVSYKKGQEASAYNGLGLTYLQMGDFPKGTKNLYEALRVLEKRKDEPLEATIYGNIGIIYIETGQFEKAEEVLLKSIEKSEKINDLYTLAGATSNLATVYLNQKKYDSAIEKLKKAAKINTEIGNENFLAINYENLFSAYTKIDNVPEAIKYGKLALDLDIKIGNKENEIIVYQHLGELYQKQKDLGVAEKYFLKSIAISDSLGFVAKMGNGYKALYKLYKEKGDTDKALIAYEEHITIKDSIYTLEDAEKIAEEKIKFEYDKKALVLKYQKQLTDEQLANQLLLTTQQDQTLTLKEQALTLSNQEKDLTQLAFLKEQAEKLEKEKDLALKNIELTAQQKQNLYLGAFIFFLLCGLGALIYFYQTMRKQKNIIAQQNQLNEHTISILSHDIKEPLLGVKLLLKKLHVNDPFLSQASLSLENQISSVNGVLNNLLNMKKLSMAENQKNATAEVQEVIQNITKQMQQAIQEKNITIQNLLPAGFTLPIAAEKLQVVVHNILSNAIKYSHPDQSIKIYKEGNGFCIQDFGVGLSDVQTVKMMTDVKNSKPGTTQEKGHGMGLYLVGMLLQSEQVKVIFESPEIGGTIVKIMS